jgi:CRP-like cAMP-binding protein
MSTAREHKDLAFRHLARNKLDEALAEYRKALVIAPQDYAARRKMAEVLTRMGRLSQAVAEYQNLAGRYATDGRFLEAIAIGKVIQQIEPGHVRTQAALAQFAGPRVKDSEWKARLPLTMTGLIDIERRTPVTPLHPVEPSEDVSVRAAEATPLFSDMPYEVMVELLQRLQLRSAAPGEAIVVEGERGTSMFVLVQGSVKVVRGGKKPKVVDEMGEGSFFGEIALLADVPRVASIVAEGECLLLEVPRELLRELSARFAGLEEILQRFYKERLLANLLRSNDLFSGFSREALERLVDRFVIRTAERGDVLIRQGDQGRGLWVLLRGRVCAFDVPSREEYPELQEGAVFGEIALLELCAATAAVRAETSAVLLFLDRDAFADEVLKNPAVTKKLDAIARERLERSASLLDGEVMLPSMI